MKKLLFAFAGILLSLSINAQMNTGSYFVSGASSFNFGFSSQAQVDKDIQVNMHFNPKVGYFLKNRLGIGGAMEYDNIYSRSVDALDNKSTYSHPSVILGPFARYYVEYGSLIPFAEGFVGVGTRKDKFDGQASSTTNIFKFTTSVGIDYFLNETVAAEAMMQYYLQRDGQEAGHSTSNGLMFLVGIRIFFGSV